MTLKRSNDRKVANLSRRNSKGKYDPVIKNAFGLPAGRNYSCPGATSVCESVCYAGAIERQYTNVIKAMIHNFDLLKDADLRTMINLLDTMINEFEADCHKRGADKAFRIHWDGDYFSRTYASAWRQVILRHPDVQFWAYTRSFTPACNVVDILADIPNLALYLSVDAANAKWSHHVVAEYPSVMVAALADTMNDAALVIQDIRENDKPGAKCPELIKALPLIDERGGACFTCQLCPQGKADIRFAITKAGRV